METAARLDSFDAHAPAVPARMPSPPARPELVVVPEEEAVRAATARPLESAAEEFYCALCRHAQFDRFRSLCLCTSPVAEFARQTIFAGQTACGWFEPKRKRTFKWSICSGRMF